MHQKSDLFRDHSTNMRLSQKHAYRQVWTHTHTGKMKWIFNNQHHLQHRNARQAWRKYTFLSNQEHISKQTQTGTLSFAFIIDGEGMRAPSWENGTCYHDCLITLNDPLRIPHYILLQSRARIGNTQTLVRWMLYALISTCNRFARPSGQPHMYRELEHTIWINPPATISLLRHLFIAQSPTFARD